MTITDSVLRLFYIIAFFAVVQETHQFELPFLQSCTISNHTCHCEMVNKFIRMYRQGIPELNIPAIEPMSLGDISVDTKSIANINFNLNMKNVRLDGYTHSKCIGSKGYADDSQKIQKVIFKILSPQIIFKSRCHTNGNLLLFNINGEADMDMLIHNVSSTFQAYMEPYTRPEDGANQTYYRIKKFTTKFVIDNVKTSLSNSTLFNGDPTLNRIYEQTVDSIWPELKKEVLPSVQEAHTKITRYMMDRVLATMPFEKWFKSDEKIL